MDVDFDFCNIYMTGPSSEGPYDSYDRSRPGDEKMDRQFVVFIFHVVTLFLAEGARLDASRKRSAEKDHENGGVGGGGGLASVRPTVPSEISRDNIGLAFTVEPFSAQVFTMGKRPMGQSTGIQGHLEVLQAAALQAQKVSSILIAASHAAQDVAVSHALFVPRHPPAAKEAPGAPRF